MASRTALITGVLGQDGSLLAELLLSRNYRVVGVARPGARLPLAGPLAAVAFAEVNLLDPAAVRKLLEQWRPDELYHLAAFHHSSQDGSVSAGLTGKEAMVETNFGSTKTLAFALAEMQSTCHLVFASSSQIYTATEMRHEINEQSERRPSTFYGHTKSWSMDLLASLRRESGLRSSSAILFNHESSRRGTQFVSRKITRAAAQAAAGGKPLIVLGNIGARVDWSSAHDVVDALSLIGSSGEPSTDYVVASGSTHSVRDWLEVSFGSVDLDWTSFVRYDDDRSTSALVGNTRALEKSVAWVRSVSFERLVCDMTRQDVANLGSQSRTR